MIRQLHIVGIIMILLAVMHAGFPRYFKWKTDLANTTLINREMMYVHTLFLSFTVLLMGLLCLLRAQVLLATPLGKDLLLGLSLFWLVRLLVQFFGYSTALWKGRTFETFIHLTFSLLWAYITTVFVLAFFN